MRFKHGRDRKDYYGPPRMEYDRAANAKLKRVLKFIDDFSQLTHCGEITITSYYREGDPKLHGIWQAADIRCHEWDKPRWWYRVMELVGWLLSQRDNQIIVYRHLALLGKPNEHIHIGIKTEK
ncbi:MAG: hypothetical protein U9N61_02680 [Euryarchaeota archaeon]|nr:hypothetical protein [Euryarchaeota archaeon]